MSDHDTWNMFAAAVAQGMLASTAHVNANGPDTFFPDPLAKRAAEYADALLAESKKRAEAEAAEYKDELRRVINGEPAEPTPPQPDDDGWIKWEGGECPLPDNPDVIVKWRNGATWRGRAFDFQWHNMPSDPSADIRAYRIVSEAGVTK